MPPTRPFVSTPALFGLLAFIGSVDFRRTDSGESGIVQYLSTLIIVATCLCIALRFRTFARLRITSVAKAAVLFAVWGTGVGLARGQPLYYVLAASVPLVLFGTVVGACDNADVDDAELQSVIKVVMAALAIGSVWKAAFGFQYSNETIETIRYQIVSGAVVLLFASACALYWLRQSMVLVFLFVLLAVGIVAVSVTRTYAVVFGACVVVSFLISRANPKARSGTNLLVVVAVASFALLAISQSAGDVFVRWVERTTVAAEYGFDPTGLARLAQNAYMLDVLMSTKTYLFFGTGLVSESGFAGESAALLASAFGNEVYDYVGSGFGHNTYLGTLYVGGIIFGGSFLLILVWDFFRHALIPFVRQMPGTRVRADSVLWRELTLLIGAVSTAGFMLMGAFAGLFNDRSMSVYFGLAVGLMHLVARSDLPRSMRTPNPPYVQL